MAAAIASLPRTLYLRLTLIFTMCVALLSCNQAIASNFREGVSLTPSLTFTTLTTTASTPETATLTNTTNGALPI